MYNSEKFTWVHLLPGRERFTLEAGRFVNFQASSLSPEQYAIFLSAMATVASNGVNVRTLYVWESNADRHVYIYTESGKVIASYPPPEGYDPYKLSRRQLEAETALGQEEREELINSLDPSRVILRAEVAEGPLPIAPPILQPELSNAPLLPGGFGTLQGGGEPGPSLTTLSQEEGYDWVLRLNSPGIDTWIPIWRANDLTLPASGWGTPDTRTISTAADSISKDISDEHSSGLRLRYYFTPYLDTTYVQAPSSSSLTVRYVTTRNVSPTAYLWTTWAEPPEGDRKTVANITPSSISYGGYTAYIYQAQFNNLTPDTEYRYTFEWESGGPTFRSSVPTARTWPSPQDVGEFNFIAYGDNRGGDDHSFQTLHRDVACLGILNGAVMHEADYPRFVLHVGDLVQEGADVEQWIPHFFRPAGALLGRVPVFPCIGNHDWDPNGLGVAKYTALFKLPSADERWYSFTYGNSYFIVLDSYSPYSSGAQYDWLVGTALPAAASYDWVFVLFHCPPYTDCSGHHYNADDVRAAREQLAEPRFENKDGNPLDVVNVVFCGHSHLYERSYRRSVQYVVTGGGGADLHEPGDDNLYRFHGESVRHHCTVHVFPNDLDDPVVTAHRNDGSVIESVVLPAGGRWRWYSQGQQPPDIGGHCWREPEYDDSSWNYGPAELGYSMGQEKDEATIAPYGPNPKNKWIGYYFRNRFYVGSPAAFGSVKLRLLRDDGAVVYINGEEVVRSNMPGTPGDPVPYATLASSDVEGVWPAPPNDEIDISDAPVNTGWNYAAVQVHQVSPSNSDVSFDMEIVGRKPPQ